MTKPAEIFIEPVKDCLGKRHGDAHQSNYWCTRRLSTVSQIYIYEVKDCFDDVHKGFIGGQQDGVKTPIHDRRTLSIGETVVALQRWEAINLESCMVRHIILKTMR
jgi:hypothetical protein